MTLPSSGPIKLSDIRTELGLSGTLNLGHSSVRSLSGVASGELSLSDLHGKTAVFSIGSSWSTVTTFGTTNNYDCLWDAVTQKFFAVGESAHLYTSPDGVNWSGPNLSFYNAFYGNPNTLGAICHTIVRGPDKLIAYGQYGACAYSTDDGATWTNSTAPSTAFGGSSGAARCVIYVPSLSLYIGCGIYRIAYSSDGLNWTPIANSYYLMKVAFGNGILVASGANRAFTSTTGTSWAEASSFNTAWGSSGSVYGLDFASGSFIAVGAVGTGKCLASTNGTTWAARSSFATAAGTNSYFGSVKFCIDRFLTHTQTGKILYSLDGVTWVNYNNTNVIPTLGQSAIATNGVDKVLIFGQINNVSGGDGKLVSCP